ncbi:L-lactate permease [hydrothermal vent metagenome]|uniref:L-lactate permease n=1 Tax=hydrothermal vent metagenome TaxID=652676 RepID=A0A1W1EBL4_9ZZZZ
MNALQILVSAMPIILPFIFLVVMKMPAKKGMVIASVIFVALAYFVWGMNTDIISASILQGAHKTLTILYILFGAIILLKVLTYTDSMNKIKIGFGQVSKDMRVQAVIVGFLFVSLIEGAAGFGTPAVVAGPLLMSLGFSPLAAAAIALIGDSSAVSFGAVGTPVVVGLGNIQGANFDFYHQIAVYITKIDFPMMVLMPSVIVLVLTLNFGKKGNGLKSLLEVLPWTLMIGLLYASTALLCAILLGAEFVSLLAPLFVIFVASVTASKKILLPKNTIWTMEGVVEEEDKNEQVTAKELVLSWLPYISVVLMLIATRVFPEIKTFVLTNLDMTYSNILGEGITSKWQVLYSPGSILLVAAVFAYILGSNKKNVIKRTFVDTVTSMTTASIVLVFTLALVQVFVNSANSEVGIGMPIYLANFLADTFQSSWIFVSTYLGILGAFITGSATVSTLTFSPIQYEVAQNIGIDNMLILAQQVIGGASGNMICIHNVVAASTVVGLANREGDIIRKTLPVALLYGAVVGISGYIYSIM